MKIPVWIGDFVLRVLLRQVVGRRLPDVTVGGESDPYMLRWHVIPRNQRFNVYLHRFIRSDDDRALHDHPARNLSWILSGGYTEVLPATPPETGLIRMKRRAGRLVSRPAEEPHRIEIDPMAPPTWTLFVSGRKAREWGFLCPAGWRHWKVFTGAGDYTAKVVGPGCD